MVNFTAFMYKTFFKGTSGMVMGMCLSLFMADMIFNRGINYLWAWTNKGVLIFNKNDII